MEVEESEVEIPTFRPRKLTNLAMIDQMESLAPVTDMKVADLANEDTPQIYTLCGRGPRSTLRVLRHGLAVTVMAVSELPGESYTTDKRMRGKITEIEVEIEVIYSPI